MFHCGTSTKRRSRSVTLLWVISSPPVLIRRWSRRLHRRCRRNVVIQICARHSGSNTQMVDMTSQRQPRMETNLSPWLNRKLDGLDEGLHVGGPPSTSAAPRRSMTKSEPARSDQPSSVSRDTVQPWRASDTPLRQTRPPRSGCTARRPRGYVDEKEASPVEEKPGGQLLPRGPRLHLAGQRFI